MRSLAFYGAETLYQSAGTLILQGAQARKIRDLNEEVTCKEERLMYLHSRILRHSFYQYIFLSVATLSLNFILHDQNAYQPSPALIYLSTCRLRVHLRYVVASNCKVSEALARSL